MLLSRAVTAVTCTGRVFISTNGSGRNYLVRRAAGMAVAAGRSDTHAWYGATTLSSSSSSLSTNPRHFSSSAATSSTSGEAPVQPQEQQQQHQSPAFTPTPDRKYEFFSNVEITDKGVAVIKFDCPGKPVNTISFKLAKEAEMLWTKEIQNNSAVKAVVFTSAKPGMFVAGADIFDIQAIPNKQELLPIMENGLNWFQSLKRKGVPLVAAIDGPALGGGLEWALWCDYRICTDNAKTKLGLPEVKLGLLPGFGGTQNLHATVGLQNAMDMMLTGKEVRPDKARKMGLVDLVVAPASLEKVAIQTAEDLATGKLKVQRKKKSIVNRLLEDFSLGRKLLWSQVKKMVDKNTEGHYPAPYAIIQCVQYGLDNPSTKFKNEREQFVKLAATPESEALIGIFDGMTKMKKHSFGADAALPVNKVAVMGAGLMGAGIAQVTAEKGIHVLLKDRNDEAVSRGLSYMQDNWGKKLSKKRLSQYQYNKNTSAVTPLTDDIPSWKQHFAGADVVIEAVFEDLTLKKKIVADMESVTPDHCIFATNTSAIPIASIAEGAKRPQNIIGMHYFSPVPAMPLLEIIPHKGTSDRATATAFEVGSKQGKTCIIVKDVPGFYVNRCFGPYLVEASALVRDGVSLEALDKAIKKFGMPVGPITLADQVGLDVISHVATFLSNADLGVRMQGGDVSLMTKMVEKGWLGKKSGQGFYTYKGKEKPVVNAEVQSYVKQFTTRNLNLSETDIQNRLMSRFINEAAKCLEDEIIENPVVGDIGLVFGTGFAPFRGGPFRYLDQVGVTKYVDIMNGFANNYGPQFEPCQLLKDYAATNKKFHSK